MRRLAKEIKVCEITDGKPGAPLALRPEPVLRYTNPTLFLVDGTLWVWGERGRPTAVMKLGLAAPTGRERRWRCRVNALSPKQIEVEFDDGVTWSSQKDGLHLRPLSDTPAPVDAAAHRLIQAKDIARRLSASMQSANPSGRIELRLLSRPIDRYSDPKAGLLDGFLFSFVYGNTPSALLLLEACSEGANKQSWRCAMVRQGAAAATALLDGKPFWSVTSASPAADSGLFIGRLIPASAAEQE